MNLDISSILSFLTDPQLPRIVWIIKTVFISISLVLLGFVIFLLIKSDWIRFRYLDKWAELLKERPYGIQKEFKKWSKINKRLETGDKADYKMAVIEADDVLKDVLKKMKYEGEFLEDILKEVNERVLPSVEEVKKAHEIRNRVMHDPDYALTQQEAKNVLKVYQQALRELEMIS